jgi:hypothetical protein
MQRFASIIITNPSKSFVLLMEKNMHGITTRAFRVRVMSYDFAQDHPGPYRMFVSVTHHGGPRGLP